MKYLFLVRGLPGAGKTSFSKIIWSDGVIFEADKYFENNGVYNFEASKVKEAHAWCKNQVEQSMIKNQTKPQYFPEIVVSNTFTQEWELEDYIKLAKKYNYKLISLIVENRHGNKSIHNVPDSTLEKMKNRFEIKL